MEEKILIKSKQYDVKKFLLVMVIIGAVLSSLLFCLVYNQISEEYDSYYKKYSYHQLAGSGGKEIETYPSKVDYYISNIGGFLGIIEGLAPVAFTSLIGFLIYLWLHSYEIVVTNKRIYGRVAWGKRVDLPLDSVSATATKSLLKGISVSTSSGRISFLLVKNVEEIYKTISSLLIERQSEKRTANIQTTELKTDSADELKKFKDLLDNGVITQEEFDAKKKQLLGL